MYRREFLKTVAGASVAALCPGIVQAQQMLPRRLIPGTSELLPVIGLGSTKAVLQIPDNGVEPLYNVIDMLLEHGGCVIDTAPRNEAIDTEFGKLLQDRRWKDRLFVSSKINNNGRQQGIEQMEQTQQLFGRRPADLIQVESMVDIDNHWPSLKEWKQDGGARYIGVTVARNVEHDSMEAFMKKESPDFIQVNYSVAEPQAEEKLLPIAQDMGIAVQINRPFMNGTFFDKVKEKDLPGWVSEFECESWAQFSLKYILSHSAVTCVLTETTNPTHMLDNLQAAFGPMPDSEMKLRMRNFIENI